MARRGVVLAILLSASCAVSAQTALVPSGTIKSGTIKSGNVAGGSATGGGKVFGLDKAKVAGGKITAGRVAGKFEGNKFSGSVTGATIEGAKITDVHVNHRDAAGAVTSAKTTDMDNVTLSGVSLSDAEIDPAIIAVGLEGASTTPNNLIYKGDSIVFGVGMEFTDARNPTTTIQVPRGARFRVVDEALVGGEPHLFGTFSPVCRTIYRFYQNGSLCDERLVDDRCSDPTQVTSGRLCAGRTYRVKKSDLPPNDHDRFGYSYGLMVVPFKAYLGEDRMISTGATIGPYIGYGASSPGRSATVAFSAGIASIPVTTTLPNGDSNTENHTALSIAFGYLATIKDSFKMGVFVGWDLLNKDSGYNKDGKPWIGLQLGFETSN